MSGVLVVSTFTFITNPEQTHRYYYTFSSGLFFQSPASLLLHNFLHLFLSSPLPFCSLSLSSVSLSLLFLLLLSSQTICLLTLSGLLLSVTKTCYYVLPQENVRDLTF